MLIILIIFDCSLGFRFALNIIIFIQSSASGQAHEVCTDIEGIEYKCINPYPEALYNLITQYFWDYIPIMAILLFHKKNFSIDTSQDFVTIRASQLDQSGHLLHLKSSDSIALSNEDHIRETIKQSFLKF